MPDNNRPRRPKEPKKKSAKLTNIDAQLDALLREREAEVKSINEAENKKDTRRKILAGQAVLKEALRREPVRKFMYNLLNKDLTRPGDRALFDDLMEEWGMPPLLPLTSAPPDQAPAATVEESIPEMESEQQEKNKNALD